jgi:hypothetical protein
VTEANPLPSDGDHARGRGWHLVAGLALLSAITVAIAWMLPHSRPDAGPALGLHPAIIAPWAACARSVVALGRDVQVVGPTRITWDASGDTADVLGIAARPNQPDRPFACRAVRKGPHWEVDRLTFAP